MNRNQSFPSPLMRIMLWAYQISFYLLLVPLLIYLWLRGRKDKLYTKHLTERFGFYGNKKPADHNPVWVHAVSLGELRSAVPLINALLARNEHVVTTHFTPAGRREASSVFASQISSGQLTVIYLPLEFGFAFRRFFKHFKPKYGLVMEVEFWPCMITSARSSNIPLLLCNGQYPTKSFNRDTKGFGFRSRVVKGFAGVMVKSDLQAERFASLGVTNIAVTGELRFEQPVPEHQLLQGRLARKSLNRTNAVAIASAVEGEDDTYIRTISATIKQFNASGLQPPLFIYVPRAPERFEDVRVLIESAGLNVVTRSTLLDKELNLQKNSTPFDVLLGDSMGEMYFYLSMADRVIVGGGFTPHGAHNISEALALSKPVLVGPSIWTIEYPAFEAIEAGVLCQLTDRQSLLDEILKLKTNIDAPTAQQVDQFFSKHTGAVDKTLTAIPALLAQARSTTNH